MKVEKLSLVELTALNRRIEAAIPIARNRELGEVRKQLSEMAAKSGFKLSDLFGVNATIRKPVAPKYRDRETGVMWAGRGRPPRQFDRSRAETLAQ
tara:strand:+ start:125 stop:412 length:288 start_codon:yes stop_codon:yes gene_type:complete